MGEGGKLEDFGFSPDGGSKVERVMIATGGLTAKVMIWSAIIPLW